MGLPTNAKYLFLFAHPDDDVLICGTMKMLIDEGAEVHGAWLGSGDFLGQEQTRRAERSRAAKIMGLKEPRMHVLGVPDMHIVTDLEQAAVKVTALFARLKPDIVFVPAYEGGHPHHDAVNFLAYEASRRTGLKPKLFEFPLYNATGPAYHWWWRINDFPPGGPPALSNPLNRAAVNAKYQIMRTYSSQWMYMIPARVASPRSQMLEVGEIYRPCPPNRDHTIPPHDGMLSYERWFNCFLETSFDDFRKAVLKTRQAR
jgi:LmbE family N-acetylglucosaminyl deacetylase